MNNVIRKLELTYQKVRAQRRNVIRMLQDKQEENVQKLLEQENNKLYQQELELQKRISHEVEKVYSSCDHIWADSLITDDGDYHRYNSRVYCGCIRCGLDQSVLHEVSISGMDSLCFREKIMYDFMKKKSSYLVRKTADVPCDFELGKAIYQRIREYYPDLDDETVRKYFEISLDDIMNIPVSDERKEKRAKRLSLDSNYKWPRK